MPTSPTLELRLVPGLHALSGVVAVLHARQVEPESITWSRDGSLQIRVLPGSRLVEQLARRVDVLEVTA